MLLKLFEDVVVSVAKVDADIYDEGVLEGAKTSSLCDDGFITKFVFYACAWGAGIENMIESMI